MHALLKLHKFQAEYRLSSLRESLYVAKICYTIFSVAIRYSECCACNYGLDLLRLKQICSSFKQNKMQCLSWKKM